MASQEPIIAPCAATASKAYWEQLGSNRQPLPGPKKKIFAGESTQR